jgi:hypothetical protein
MFNLAAVIQDKAQFVLIILGAILQGITYAATQNLRFAVIRIAPPEWSSRAVAYLLAGGTFAAGIGPEVTKYTRSTLVYEFAGNYVLLGCLYGVMCLIPWIVNFSAHSMDTATPEPAGTKRVYELASNTDVADCTGDGSQAVVELESGAMVTVDLTQCDDDCMIGNNNATNQSKQDTDVPPPRSTQEIFTHWPCIFIRMSSRQLFWNGCPNGRDTIGNENTWLRLRCIDYSYRVTYDRNVLTFILHW